MICTSYLTEKIENVWQKYPIYNIQFNMKIVSPRIFVCQKSVLKYMWIDYKILLLLHIGSPLFSIKRRTNPSNYTSCQIWGIIIHITGTRRKTKIIIYHTSRWCTFFHIENKWCGLNVTIVKSRIFISGIRGCVAKYFIIKFSWVLWTLIL